MASVRAEITMSLDGFVAGPDQTLDQPLGQDGERLHEWVVRTASFRQQHGLEGGEANPDSEISAENAKSTGAYVLGRRMFSGGEGPWEEDANADGWWGDDPPFHVPVFVLTHHPREPLVKEGGTTFTFVTDGVEAALGQAREAAGGKDVTIAGGAMAIQECLRAGLLDELRLHLVPLLLGRGVRLFDEVDPVSLELTQVLDSPSVTHLTYRIGS